MSEQTKETTELVEVEAELVEYEFQDLIDDAVAMGKRTADMLNDFIYTFKQSGREIDGLTAAAYQQMALERNISTLDYEEDIYTDDNGKITGALYRVQVGIPEDGKPKEVWQTRWGIAFESAIVGGKFDKFVFQKAFTKAERNAIKRLIKATDQYGAIDTFKALGQKPPTAPPVQHQAQQALPAEPKEDSTHVARKAMFAKYNERKPELETMGITEDIFKAGLYARYKVESRADMTEADYKNARASLDGNFAKWILELGIKEEDIHF